MVARGILFRWRTAVRRRFFAGRLIRPLEGRCEDVVYTGHWLVFPRTKRYSRSMVMFLTWLAKELGLEVNLDTLDVMSSDQAVAPVLRAKTAQKR